MKLSSESRVEIASAYADGESPTETGRRYGVSASAVLYTAKRHGVGIRAPSPGKGRRYRLDESAFDLATVESAYWGGFLLADGCVTDVGEVCLLLAVVDVSHVEKFRQFIQAERPAVVRGAVGSSPLASRTAQVFFRVNSSRLVCALARYGVAPRKTAIASVPPEFQSNRDFWRGVIDGDGCVGLHRHAGYSYPLISLSGTEAVTRQFEQYARTVGSTRATARAYRGITWQFQCVGRAAVAVLRALYGDCTVALDRKLALATSLTAQGEDDGNQGK